MMLDVPIRGVWGIRMQLYACFKYVSTACCLVTLFSSTAWSAVSKMGEIAIFNELVGWTNVGAAKLDTEKILKTKFARKYQSLQ